MAIPDRDRDRDRDIDGHDRLTHQPDKQPYTPLPTAPEKKPYHAKRPHRKSRLGCRNCKTRRVKCDEAKPSCRNCNLRRETCAYPSSSSHLPPQVALASSSFPDLSGEPTAPTAPAVSALASPVSPLSLRTAVSPAVSSTSLLLAQGSSPAPSFVSRRGSAHESYSSNGTGRTELIMVDEPPIRLVGADEHDMRLLWFYTTETYASVSVEAGRIPYVDSILKSDIVRFAFQSPFLMDCILGLSAMHMQSLHVVVPMSKAITYRARAFSGYRKAIERAQPKDFPALLACSVLLCALSSELFREPDMKPLYVIDWMVVWRGIGLVMDFVPTEALFSSGLYKLFSRPAFNLDQAASYVPDSLLSMTASIKEGDEDYPHVDAYYDTLKLLGGLFLELEAGISPVLSVRIMTFFTFLPGPFVELARKHRPRALVIIAHYLAFLKMAENVWWLVGIADRGTQDIIDHLGREWQSLLTVPRAAMGLYDKVDLAKLIKGNHSWQPARADQVVIHPSNLTMVNNVGEKVAYDKQRGWVPLSRTTVPDDGSSGSYHYLSPPSIT